MQSVFMKRRYEKSNSYRKLQINDTNYGTFKILVILVYINTNYFNN